MNSNAKAWVAALRSGHFEQTTGNLHDAIGYCCLGVACRVAIEAGLPVKAKRGRVVFFYDGYSTVLPPSVQAWLGLTTAQGNLGNSNLTALNDGGAAFDEIADIIEHNESELFNA